VGQESVRVVDSTREPPSPDEVFVADVRQASVDGTYLVHTMARADFEGIAVSRRAKAGPTMASVAPPQPGAPAASDEAAGQMKPALPVVVIYGAEWCSACHDAARYMRRKGIPYVEKDIEKDPVAAREMEEKLAKHRMRSGSIPVIDVRGTVMVGFDPEQIEAALRAAPI
jgi:glutaredoxin